ncbi:hypothetical protein HYH03_008825 [Edaphochlamys debaryana]|uniref:Major facilitator superfamily (MFS) profile domain-containing protein n=1 Tax=Edaphochlamys debaryana TaxID=47281 RepID=A0A836BXM5_9CHLO|nr:hypothetical protein HYH03_008825 [Edaphochlamys debaryana]|eukprot:KAG2492911.1 hypothetical protein HYH03_008825 [Edaphochlamys debaryana]
MVLFASLKASIDDGLFLSLWTSGVWRFMVFLFMYSLGIAVIYPITPTLMTNGFASLAAGHPIDCTTFPPSASPKECVDAHSTAVTWMSWTNFVSSSLLTFLCAPYVGHLSDRIGRKPFMIAGIALWLLPLSVLMLHLRGLVPIYWYYPASAVGGMVSSFTMMLTAVADLMEQRHRATAIGYLTSCFSLGILVGPILGGYLSITAALWTTLATTFVTLAFVALAVPESAPGPLAARKRAAALRNARRRRAGRPANAPHSPASSFSANNPAIAAAALAAEKAEEASRHGHGHAHGHCTAEEAAEALAAAEAVSYISGQQHLSGGAVAAAAAPAGPADTVAAAGCPLGVGEDDPVAAAEEGAAGCKATTGAAEADGSAPGTGSAGLATGWNVIRRSSFYQRIALIWVVVSMTWEGAGELLMQYLQLTLGFGTRDQAHVLVVLAAGGLVVKLGLLALLVRALGEKRLLAFGLVAYAAECLALAAAPGFGKAAGLAAVSVGSLASVCWPALVALQTAGVAPEQQGAVFGALQAISSMASGLGPLAFAFVFRQVTRTDSTLPFSPSVVWYMAAGLTAVAIALTLSLPAPEELKRSAAEASRSGRQEPGQEGGAEGARRKAPAGPGAGGLDPGVGAGEGLTQPLLGGQ